MFNFFTFDVVKKSRKTTHDFLNHNQKRFITICLSKTAITLRLSFKNAGVERLYYILAIIIGKLQISQSESAIIAIAILCNLPW